MKTPKFLYLSLLLTLLLSACGSAGNAPEAIPTIVLGQGNVTTTEASPRSTGDIVASALVVPAQEAHLAFLTGGNIKTINVTLGEEVKAGQILVELDNTIALLEIERAKRALRELTSPLEIATAEEDLAIAQDNFEDAQDKVEALAYKRASDTTIDNVKAEIDLAEKQLTLTSSAYKSVANRADG
ncbi:MAG: biotin/lipoyl-binding protein, partial [Anaerolineae bacterium]|nr:biotin/lipoyl-binding protein [Anaerolineae bacterium]